MTTETKLSKMNVARLEKQMNKVYRFDDGVMTMQAHLVRNEFSRRQHFVRNTSLKKIDLEYKEIKDKHEYYLKYKDSPFALEVSKMIYDYMSFLPEEFVDNRI